MQSLSFTPGRAFLSSNSPTVPWTVVFEDEGLAAYFYACDRSQQTQEASILDAMLIYNVGSLQNPEAERLAAVEWSRYGLQAGLFTRDAGRIMTAYRELEVGAVIVGDTPTWRMDSMPYGGIKDSGLGREGVRWAIEEMTEPRMLVMAGV